MVLFRNFVKNDTWEVPTLILRKHYATDTSILHIDERLKYIPGGISADYGSYWWYTHNNKILNIPNRIHFNFPDEKVLIQLTDLQQTILNCIYLRHHDGFIRQKRLESLLGNSNSFIIPFTFQLLGEYVVEILEVLEKHINYNTIDDYAIFIMENPKFWIKTKSRVISYWNAYYRRPQQPLFLPPKYPDLNGYIGQKIVNHLEAHLKQLKVT